MLESGRPGERHRDTLVLHRVCFPPQTGADAQAQATETIIRRIVAVSQSAAPVGRSTILAPEAFQNAINCRTDVWKQQRIRNKAVTSGPSLVSLRSCS